MVAAARCTTLIAVPTLTSSPSQNGCSALYPAASIMPIILGVEYTGGSSGFHAESVFLNSTVVSASPRVPMGISLAMLRDYREHAESKSSHGFTRMTRIGVKEARNPRIMLIPRTLFGAFVSQGIDLPAQSAVAFVLRPKPFPCPPWSILASPF